MTVDQNVAYGSDPLQTADIFTPEVPNGAAIVFVHGGGWIRGDKSADTEIGEYFSARGFITAIPNYRLAPKNQFPSAQEDLDAFNRWFTASDYAFDRERIGLIGASVGGTMAITSSMHNGWPVVAWSPILAFGSWLSEKGSVKPALDGASELGLTDTQAIHDAFYKYFLQAYLGTDAAAISAVSPRLNLTHDLGPTLIFNSASELAPLNGAFRFLSAAAEFGRNITLHVLPGEAHARSYTDEAIEETADFLTHYLK